MLKGVGGGEGQSPERFPGKMTCCSLHTGKTTKKQTKKHNIGKSPDYIQSAHVNTKLDVEVGA